MATKKTVKTKSKKVNEPPPERKSGLTVSSLEVTRSQEEVDDLFNKCWEAEERGGSRFRGMTYEQGIKAGMAWLLGQTKDNPMED